MADRVAAMPAGTAAPSATGEHLRVDPIACDGVGICAHLAADLVRIDSWGYPIVSGQRLTERTARQARAAVKACPHRALFVQ